MAPDPADRPPIGERYRYFWPGVSAVATVAAVAVAIIALAIRGTDSGRGSPDTSSPVGSTSPPTTRGGSTTVTSGASTGSGIALGRDVALADSAPCGAPSVGSGAAWQLTAISMKAHSYDPSYSCNLFSGAVGSLDFVLAASYRELDVAIGFADVADSSRHMVRFEVIGDSKDYLTDPRTLQFGDVQELKIDVSGVLRLRLKVTDVTVAGSSESAGRPVFGRPVLVHV